MENFKSPLPEGVVPLEVSSYVSITNQILKSSGEVWVQGEISSLSFKNHLYFTLCDSNASLNCILWASVVRSLDFVPQVGDKVVVCGFGSIYAKSGRFSLQAHTLFRHGMGYLMQQLELLKRKLLHEGVFLQAQRPLPRFVNTVGVITSKDGKAIEDIKMTLKNRNDGIKIIVYNALVQGREAPQSLIAALKLANLEKRCDVLIIGRGGGSFEDLLAFSDEALVREVAKSQIPIISAVGHEPDTALTDYAADVRASTPSVAANLVSAITKRELYEAQAQYQYRLQSMIKRLLDRAYSNLHNLNLRFYNAGPLNTLKIKHQSLDLLSHRLKSALEAQFSAKEEALALYKETLSRLDPRHQLAKKSTLIASYEQRQEQALFVYKSRVLALKHNLQLRERRLIEGLRHQVMLKQEHLESLSTRLQKRGVNERLVAYKGDLNEQIATLQALNPLKLLTLGYTVTQDLHGQSVDFDKLQVGDTLITITDKGKIRSQLIAKEKSPRVEIKWYRSDFPQEQHQKAVRRRSHNSNHWLLQPPLPSTWTLSSGIDPEIR